jgi:hypothetical protein
MEQLSLFDGHERFGENTWRVRFSEKQEEELKQAMALLIIDVCRKESEDDEQSTDA